MNIDLQQALNYANADVQGRANVSPLRGQYAQYWFATPNEQSDAARFINDVATMMATQQRMPADQALQAAAGTVMPVLVANFAMRTGIAAQVGYAEQTQINELVNKGKQLALAVAQMYQAPQVPHAYVQPQMQQQPYGGQGNWQQQQQLGITFNAVQPNDNVKVNLAGAAVSPISNAPAQAVSPIADYVPGSRVVPHFTEQGQVIAPVVPAVYEAPVVATEEELVFKPSVKTPYNVVYYPRDQRVCLTTDADGNVIEYVEELTMDYEALETRKFKSNFAVEDGKVAETLWGIMETNEITETKPSGDVAVHEIKYMGDIGDIFHGYNAAMLKFRSLNKDIQDLCWEFTYRKPYLIDVLSNQIGFMVEATKDGDPADLAAAMLKQFSESTENVNGVTKWTAETGLGMAGYVALDRYATKLVNDAIKRHLGDIGYSIDSFVADWLDLINAFSKNLGHNFIERVLPKLNRYVINRLKPIKGEELKEYITDAGNKGFANHCLLVGHNVHVSVLKVMSEELNIEWNGDIGIVCQNNVPQLHAAIKGIIKRALTRNDITSIYITTMDKRIIEVTNAWLADDSFLLSIIE